MGMFFCALSNASLMWLLSIWNVKYDWGSIFVFNFNFVSDLWPVATVLDRATTLWHTELSSSLHQSTCQNSTSVSTLHLNTTSLIIPLLTFTLLHFPISLWIHIILFPWSFSALHCNHVLSYTTKLLEDRDCVHPVRCLLQEIFEELNWVVGFIGREDVILVIFCMHAN